MTCARAIEPAKASPQDDGFEWVEVHLDCWVRYMRDDDLRLSAPKKSAGFVAGGSAGYRTTEYWEAEVEARAITIVEAALDDMTPVERAGIMHVKLAATFRFPREQIIDVYLRARQKIGVRLRAHDFT